MNRIYLIPCRERLQESLKLRRQYDGAWEYNDFYAPEVLSDVSLQREIIDGYAALGVDFSVDTIHGAFLDVTLHSMDPLIREASALRVRQSMDIAREMGVRGVVFHTGRIGGFREKIYLAHWRESNEAFLRRMLEEYPRQEIYLENMFDEAPDILASLAEGMKDCGRFGVCFDYAHGALTGCPLEEWHRQLAPYIRHFHINDNDLKEDLHLPVGQGRIDWKACSRQMAEVCGEPSILIEVKGIEKQKQSLEYMQRNHIHPFVGSTAK